MTYETQYIFLFFFFFFVVSEIHLKDFPLYSPILLTLWFTYLKTRIKESCLYLSSQLFCKTPHKTLKFQQKIAPAADKKYKLNKHNRMEVLTGKKSCFSTMYKLCFCSQRKCRKCIFRQSGELNFENLHHGATPQSH